MIKVLIALIIFSITVILFGIKILKQMKKDAEAAEAERYRTMQGSWTEFFPDSMN